jgi:asparagine synthase (glutamine-hydrolysing)
MIAGIFKRRPSDLDLRALSGPFLEALDFFRTADRSGFWTDGRALLAATVRHNAPESRLGAVPFVEEGGNLVAAFWGRLTNRGELAAALNPAADPATLSDGDLACRAYRLWGRDLPTHLRGDYSLALYDVSAGEWICPVDPMGVKPFHYHLSDDLFVFASTPALFHRLRLFALEPDLGWAASYVMGLSMDFEATVYAGVRKLPPGGVLRVAPSGVEKGRHFTFDAEKRLAGVPFGECLERYRGILKGAVGSRLTSDFPVGCESSGGIDSSAVTAVAADLWSNRMDRFHAFGLVTADAEPALALETARKYGIVNNHITCANPAESEETVNRYLDAMGMPCEHAVATGVRTFLEQCSVQGVRTLLSGFGGDEFVSTIHTRVIQDELIRKGRYDLVRRSIPGSRPLALLRLAKRILSARFREKPEFDPRFLEAWTRHWKLQPLREEIVRAFGLREAFFEQARFDAGYDDLNRFTLEKRYEPFIPTRLHDCTVMAESYGVDYGWPLLDPELIAFFLSVPTEYKIGSHSRYFHRAAMNGIVPDAVNWRNGKYLGNNSHRPYEKTRPILLHSGLHPDLALLADETALRRRLEDTGKLAMDEFIMLQTEIDRLNQLDSWLKKFHPGGASWRNAGAAS